MIPLAEIDVDALLNVVVSSLVAGLGLTLMMCVALYGTVRAHEARQDGRSAAASAFGALALVSAIVLVGAAILGFVVMTSK